MLSIFLSHAWSNDAIGRSTHIRVRQLAIVLKRMGIRPWFDENELIMGNIDAQMADGIADCHIFIPCITRDYCKKINKAAREVTTRDNCFKEWSMAHGLGKPIIPLIMDPVMLNSKFWGGVILMNLSGLLYVDASIDDPIEIASRLHRIIKKKKWEIIRKKSNAKIIKSDRKIRPMFYI